MNITIVLPSLNPDEKLNLVVDGLVNAGFKDIVLVNDGSDEAHMEPFRLATMHPEVTLLTHEVNKGKGRALKTAFAYVVENRPDTAGVVTVDGDNQHTVKDITNCATNMIEKGKVILGCRDFSGDDVPWKSRFGNRSTSNIFRLCGIKLSDTQTGLRAIPAEYLPLMCEVYGERFEYETQMLFAFKDNNIDFEEVKIETVYIEENASTHFHPIKDSWKIYKLIFKYMATSKGAKFAYSSASSCVIEYLMYVLLIYCIADHAAQEMRVSIAFWVSRVISSIYNYVINHKLVFKSDASHGKTLIKYYILVVCQALAANVLLVGLCKLLAAGKSLEVLCKVIVDVVLFIFSYQVQKRWVFK